MLSWACPTPSALTHLAEASMVAQVLMELLAVVAVMTPLRVTIST